MCQVFISHVPQDRDLAVQISGELEAAGYTTWCYEHDARPGISHPIQADQEIEKCQACLIIISPHSIASKQVTAEVVRGHEAGKPFVPVLFDVTDEEFR